MKKLTKKQIALIVLTAVCTGLLIYFVIHYVGALSLAVKQVKEIELTDPTYSSINELKKSNWMFVGLLFVFTLFYSLYLWLAISIFIQEQKIKSGVPASRSS